MNKTAIEKYYNYMGLKPVYVKNVLGLIGALKKNVVVLSESRYIRV